MTETAPEYTGPQNDEHAEPPEPDLPDEQVTA